MPGSRSKKCCSLRGATLLKKRLWHRYFPVNFVKFFRTPFSKQHLRWLLRPIESCFAKLYHIYFNDFNILFKNVRHWKLGFL